MESSTADEDLATLRRIARRMRSAAARIAWRSARQRRRIRVRHVLDLLVGAVRAPSPRRMTAARGWDIIGHTAGPRLVLTARTFTRAHDWSEIREPVLVLVHRRGLVDEAELARLEELGLVQVQFKPGTRS